MRLQKKKIRTKPFETELVNAVKILLKKEGYIKIFTEIQLIEKFIDIFATNNSMKKRIAIEVKVDSIKRAFEQAKLYKYVADKVYVAILKNGSNKLALELSKSTGIGLIFIKAISRDNYKAEIEKEPSNPSFFNEQIYSNHILNQLN